MKTHIIALAALTAWSCNALARDFLCIGEYSATVSSKNGEVTGSKSSRNDDRWLVNDQGVRGEFSDSILLNQCILANDIPRFCQRAGSAWAGEFVLYEDNIFALVGLRIEDGVANHYIIKGKCKPLN